VNLCLFMPWWQPASSACCEYSTAANRTTEANQRDSKKGVKSMLSKTGYDKNKFVKETIALSEKR
jgi:hypothetical protein